MELIVFAFRSSVEDRLTILADLLIWYSMKMEGEPKPKLWICPLTVDMSQNCGYVP